MLLLASLLGAEDREWNKVDTAFATGAVLATALDVASTRYCMLHTALCDEQNPVLGHHPSAAKMWGLAGLATVGTLGIAYLIPTPYRETWLGLVSMIEIGMVVGNKQFDGTLLWQMSF